MIAAADRHAGRIVQVIGSTFDAEFEEGHLPEIYNALRVDTDVQGVHIRLTGEVQQHLGGNRVRCVALGSTDGLVRGMQVTDTGKSVQPARLVVKRPSLGDTLVLPHRATSDICRSHRPLSPFRELQMWRGFLCALACLCLTRVGVGQQPMPEAGSGAMPAAAQNAPTAQPPFPPSTTPGAEIAELKASVRQLQERLNQLEGSHAFAGPQVSDKSKELNNSSHAA